MTDLNTDSSRFEELYDFAHRLIDGESGKFLVEKYHKAIDEVTPYQTMLVFDRLLHNGIPFEKVKSFVGKIINVFYKSLDGQTWEKPSGHHFLHYLMLENREAERTMNEIKFVTKRIFLGDDAEIENFTNRLVELITSLKAYELHYQKKENILFPYIERTFPQYNCLQLMWSFDDDFRKSIRNFEVLLHQKTILKEELNKELGRLFFVVLPVIFREEKIIFPVAYKAIPSGKWDEMMHQSFDIGWYVQLPVVDRHKPDITKNVDGKIDLETGMLTPEQLTILFSNLPVDITFVDENDEVQFFSESHDRIFARSKSIIGRKVQNCHPQESVHLVNEILNAFRTGKKNHAYFWIQSKGRFIHIRYFALRNEKGDYKGTLEVSQDVTEIRSLQGEKRLPDWVS
jgi:PAS domain S-box-containing protein